ncbi:hypothetical protein [Streptomyces sp. NPDC059916]|uniref:hypothetical protein n=1 Tax=Streptomyces sp. NPDC059916 TaxID=3347001 RepID=UPI0036C4ED06
MPKGTFQQINDAVVDQGIPVVMGWPTGMRGAAGCGRSSTTATAGCGSAAPVPTPPSLTLSGPNDAQHGWSYRLEPGETFRTVPVATALSEDDGVNGEFAAPPANANLPVVFNDFELPHARPERGAAAPRRSVERTCSGEPV